MGLKLKSVGLIAVILLGAGFLVPVMTSVLSVSGPRVPRAVAAASVETISYSGIGPTSISLQWTESTDLTFTSYALRESTTSTIGPWTVIANIYDRTNTAYYYSDSIPGATEWWEIVYHNATGSRETIPALQVTQPSIASLTASLPSSVSALLAWDNKASYGGLLSFASYQVAESANGGAYVATTTITDLTTHSYTLSNLNPSTSYSFYLNTTDQCSCAATSPSTSESNTVTLQTPGPLTSSVIAPSTTVEVGEPASFTCVAGGGVAPYTYSWSFGDLSTATGDKLSHIYSAAGTMSVTCTVADFLGTTARDSTTVMVGEDPSIIAFTASPASLSAGEKVTFTVSTRGGYGALSYSYANLPIGCRSSNATTLSCTPTSSGNYTVNVTVTDQAGESVTATISMVIGPEKVLGLPQAMGLAVIFGSILGIGVIAILSVALALRRKKRHHLPQTESDSR